MTKQEVLDEAASRKSEAAKAYSDNRCPETHAAYAEAVALYCDASAALYDEGGEAL